MIYLYAIHDPWFYGLSDGDVDDRAAFCAYEHYLSKYPEKKIIVYVGDRYDYVLQYYGHFHIVFKRYIDAEEIVAASKILICANVEDSNLRQFLSNNIEKKRMVTVKDAKLVA
jgi:hypothetical protein